MNAWFGPDVAVWFSFFSLLAVTAALEPLAFPFLVTGVATTSAFAGGLHGARRAYQAAEERRILAKDI